MLETFQGEQSCIQIIRYPDRTSQTKAYNLKIKDPSFVSQHDLEYTFNFGRILLRTLYACKDASVPNEYLKNICHSKNLKTNQIQVGVQSKNPSINTLLLSIDRQFCGGHLNHQTCVLRYESEKNMSYAIVMQPMPIEFKKIQGLLYNNMINEPIDNVIFETSQQWRNGLVLKMKRVHAETIAYQVYILLKLFSYQLKKSYLILIFLNSFKGILSDPTLNNSCFKHAKELNNKNYCNCNSTCNPCRDNNDEITPVILLEKNQFRSKRCSDFIYSAYSFNDIKLGIINLVFLFIHFKYSPT